MKNWMKRGLSLLLVMAMVFGFIPMGMVTSAKAAEEGKATLLQDAAGVVWLVKAESGAYAPASTELINMLMDEQLDDMIRDAVGKDREDESVLVKYNGMNVGSLSAITRTLQIPLDFLDENVTYVANIYADGVDADPYAGWTTSASAAKSQQTLEITSICPSMPPYQLGPSIACLRV